MTKAKKLKICNCSLIMAGIIVLASSIQLEAIGSRGIFPVWFHIVSATLFTALVFYHIFLHFRWTDWFAKFSKLKSKVTDILWWLFLVTTVTGVIAFLMWLTASTHSHFGAVHGKIGFVMLAVALGHTLKRRKFFLISSRNGGRR